MQPPTGAEILIFARALLLFPAPDRAGAAVTILDEAAGADDHRRHLGNLSRFGDGSVMSRCFALCPEPERAGDDREFLTAVICACQALLQHSRW